MGLGAVQYPDCAGDLGTWLCLQTALPAAAPLQGHLQEEKKPRNMETSALPASET